MLAPKYRQGTKSLSTLKRWKIDDKEELEFEFQKTYVWVWEQLSTIPLDHEVAGVDVWITISENRMF